MDEASRWRAIHHAAFSGRLEVVKLLLSHSVDVNVRSARGQTPLWIAAGFGRPQVVKTLLENGADPNIADNASITPIQEALKDEIRDLLREFGANE